MHCSFTIPPQLRLCRQLLDRDPKKRPSADEVPVNFSHWATIFCEDVRLWFSFQRTFVCSVFSRQRGQEMVSKITALQDCISNSTKRPWMNDIAHADKNRSCSSCKSRVRWPYRPEKECCHVASKSKFQTARAMAAGCEGRVAQRHGMVSGRKDGDQSDDSSVNIQVVLKLLLSLLLLREWSQHGRPESLGTKSNQHISAWTNQYMTYD